MEIQEKDIRSGGSKVRSLSVSVAEGGADSDELEVVSVEEGPVSAEEVAVGAGSAEEEAVGAGSSEEKALGAGSFEEEAVEAGSSEEEAVGAGSSKEEARGVGSTEVRPVSVEGAGDSADAKSSLAKSCSDSKLSRISRGSEYCLGLRSSIFLQLVKSAKQFEAV
ncbi:hypothetical protein Pcinc_009198 [Petrolisthes cinctipes]|uniref:Uncharacterized protein n=1 Tax=Petrolisthes cinctipes TaxID=88211 RepID=A0AAE1G7W9_PETCI|nr:hypothetical protein Pcinc_009198 [Petrolisthes cinctipes]